MTAILVALAVLMPLFAGEDPCVCSWYGEPFDGRLTASGRVYDMTEMTAAHKTLPLGSQLLVTYPPTGRTISVWVTDRGPYIEGRDIDLSMAAFDSLTGGVHLGVVSARYTVVGRCTEGLLYNLGEVVNAPE